MKKLFLGLLTACTLGAMEKVVERDFTFNPEQFMPQETKMPRIHVQTQEKLDDAFAREITSADGNFETARKLLAQGANPNQLIVKDRALLNSLVAANPGQLVSKDTTLLNSLTAHGTYGTYDDSVVSLIKEMLDRGAKPNAMDIIQTLQSSDVNSVAIFALLLRRNPTLVSDKDVEQFMAPAQEFANRYNALVDQHVKTHGTAQGSDQAVRNNLNWNKILSPANQELVRSYSFQSIKGLLSNPIELSTKVTIYNQIKKQQAPAQQSWTNYLSGGRLGK